MKTIRALLTSLAVMTVFTAYTPSIKQQRVYICDSPSAYAYHIDPNCRGSNGDGYVAKLDSSGNMLWGIGYRDTAQNGPYSIGIDKWDNCYIVGGSFGKMFFGFDTLFSSNSMYSFVSKINNSGHCVWSKLINNNNFCFSLAVLPNGTSFVAGSYYPSTVTIGTCNLTNGPGMFITALDSAGNCINIISASGNPLSLGLAADNNGECYTTGMLNGASTFGSYNINVPGSNNYIYVAKTNTLTATSDLGRQLSPDTFVVYPNPSNGSFTISYQLNGEQTGKVFIYTTTGEQVGEYTLTNESGKLLINNDNLSNGIYFYKLLTSDNSTQTGKIVIIK